MGKRSSRAHRREPIRRPIPPARLSAPRVSAVGHAALTEQDLVDGWVLEGGIRVRLARGDDLPAARALVALAGVELETEVADAVAAGVAGAGLRTAVRAGQDAFLRHMAEQFFAHQDGDRGVPLQHVVLVLVAEHEERGVVGALVAHPPMSVMQQVVQQLPKTAAGAQQATKLVLSGTLAIARIRALAVADDLRGHGIGAELLHRCWQVYDHSGYLIVYGQAPDTPALERFYRRQGFDVLAPDASWDPWVVFGLHVDVRPGPGERVFIRRRPSEAERRRQRVPAQRRSTVRGRFDPGTLALHDAHLQSLLQHASGEALAVQLLPMLWIKMAEGNRANACLDACATLQHAYEQYGIAAELLPVGLIVHDGAGDSTRYATDRPRWETDTEFVGHTVLLLPEHDKLIDPTIEQVPPVRALRRGPIIGRVPPEARQALHTGTSFAIPREDLIIDYTPVHPDRRGVLTNAPLLATMGEAYRRAGINLATLALGVLREPGVVERVRQAPFPGLHALLDAVGQAPLDPDDAGDLCITLPDGAGNTRKVRLEELVSAAPRRPR